VKAKFLPVLRIHVPNHSSRFCDGGPDHQHQNVLTSGNCSRATINRSADRGPCLHGYCSIAMTVLFSPTSILADQLSPWLRYLLRLAVAQVRHLKRNHAGRQDRITPSCSDYQCCCMARIGRVMRTRLEMECRETQVYAAFEYKVAVQRRHGVKSGCYKPVVGHIRYIATP
jgi:hypothetical protein